MVKKSIKGNILLLLVLGAIFLGIVASLNFLISYRAFERAIGRLEKEASKIITEEQKRRLVSSVESCYSMVNFMQNQELEEAKRVVKTYTDTLSSILYKVYWESIKRKSEEEVKKDLVAFINSFRYEPNGYFFAVDNRRILVACAQKEFIGKKVESLPSIPRSIAERLIKRAEEGGGFVTYRWKKPGAKKLELKVSYVTKLHILNWYLGTGIYLSDIRKRLEKSALSVIKNSFHNIWIFDLKNRRFLIKPYSPIYNLIIKMDGKLLEAKEGTFINQKNVMSYVKPFEPWEWVIGSSTLTGQFEKLLKKAHVFSKEEAKHTFYMAVGMTLFAVFIMYLLVYIFGARSMIEDLKKIRDGMEKLIITRLSRVDPCFSEEKVVDLKREDEIGEIANLLNTIVERTFYLRCFKATIEEDNDPEVIYERIKNIMMERVGAEKVVVMEPEDSKVKVASASDTETLKEYKNLVHSRDECRAFKTGKTVFSTPSMRQCPNYRDDEIAVCIPLNTGDKVLGVVKLLFPVDTDPLVLREKIDEATVFVNEATPVIEARMYEKHLKEFSLRDPLTGLYNRRYLEEYLEHIVDGVVRRRSLIGVLMADIDHFKRVNDTFGHAAGDMVLREVAGVIKESVRKSDLVVRYGGEEFLVLLVDAKEGFSEEVAEKIRKRVEKLQIHSEGGKPIKVTITIGISEFPRDTDDIWEAIRFADAALYKGKEEGRNRCSRYKPEKTEEGGSHGDKGGSAGDTGGV